VDVFVGFEFDDGQAMIAGGGKHVEHSAVGGGEGWDLRIEGAVIEMLIDRAHVADDQRLKPALGMQAKKLVMTGALRAARGAQAADEVIEGGGIAIVEDALFRADAEGNLLAAAEGGWFVANAGAGEFQAKDGDFAFGQASENLTNGIGETVEGRRFIGTAHQAGVNVAAVSEIELGQSVVVLIEFVQVPLGGSEIEVRQTFAGQGRCAGRQEKFEAFEEGAGIGRVAAGIEPEYAEGEGRVDGGLGLLLVDAEHCERGAALANDAAGVDGTEEALEIHRVAEFGDGESGKMAFEGAAQVLRVDGAGGAADQRCSGHLLYSPDTESFESSRSKMRAPSSRTEAWREPPRKSSSRPLSDSGVMFGFFRPGCGFVSDL